MKKLSLVLFVLMLLALCTSAMAGQVTLGDTGLSMELPSGYESESLTQQDISEGVVGYWYSNDLDIIVYVTATQDSLDDVISDFRSDSATLSAGTCSGTMAGQTFAYATYKDSDDDGEYFCVEYFTVMNGQLVEICFYMAQESDSQLTVDIMNTLQAQGSAAAPSYAAAPVSGNAQQLGSSRLAITLPSDFEAEALTAEDKAENMVHYWANDTLAICVYVEAADGATLDTLLSEFASDSTIQQSGTTTLSGCGLAFAYCVYNEQQDNDNLTVIDYATVLDNQVVEICFVMYADDAATASAQAAAILESAQLLR